MNLLDVETDIIAKLQNDISGIEIRSYPPNAAEFKLLHPLGSILVRYDNSDYSIPIPNSKKTITQDRTARWPITIIYKGLIAHNASNETEGLYVRLKQVRECLTGYTPGTQSGSVIAESTVMYPVSDRFLDEDEGKWYHEIVFEHMVPEVAT